MAATQKMNIAPYASRNGTYSPAAIVKRKVAASQGIQISGTPSYLSTSGTTKIATTSNGTNDAFHLILVKGYTAEKAANTELSYFQIERDKLWQIMVENDGTDAAATQALVGNQYGLTVSATAGQVGYTTVDTNNANATIEVVDIYPNVSSLDPNYGSTSDSPGILIVRFLAGVIDQALA